ncbi:MAG: glycosyltransferase [Verrucomicrobia bacterium]|nr:glycosyltransferase [Verrucomicrobiota bacterium]MCH8512272.1 glycosyltransferase [Kiritimatiellia bacterium]
MNLRRMDQLLAGFADGDAISQEARLIRRLCRGMGIASEIYAPPECIAPAVADECRSAEDFPAESRDMVMYHYSMDSSVTDLYFRASARKVVRYHNITPAEFFDGFDDETAVGLRAARRNLPAVLERADKACAVSAYNAEELKMAGFGKTPISVIPLLFSFEECEVAPDPRMLRRFRGPLKTILFLGRIVPNKCVEDLLLAFAWYHRTLEPASRLILAGSEHSCPRYFSMLSLLAGRLGLNNVCFEGFVSDGGRSACYQTADIFVTTSRHEGFCLPLIESMVHDVPVLARAQGGMQEALDGSGVLFEETSPRVLAELIHRVVSGEKLRKEIFHSQRERIRRLRQRDLRQDCLRLMA